MDEKGFEMQNYEKLFKSQSVWKSIFSLAGPAMITILVMIFYNMADMFFIGRLGNTAMVASISLVSPVFNVLMAIATMAGAGDSIMIANAFGAGEVQKARTYSSLCFYFCLMIGIVLIPVLLGIYQIAVNFLQAAKNARAAIVASVLRQGVILIPMLYLMHAAFGYIGIALSHTVTDIAAALIGLFLFLRQYRKFMAS